MPTPAAPPPYLAFDAATRRLRLDPHEGRFVQNPGEAYAWLHRQGGPFFWEDYGLWCFGGFEEVGRLLRDRRLGRQGPAGVPDRLGVGQDRSHLADFDRVEANSMLELEPPAHTRLRTLVNRAFVSRQVERLRPRIERLANELVDRFEPGRPVDLLTAFAAPLPITIIAEMLGVPVEMGPQLALWSHRMVAMYMHGRTRNTEEAANRAALEFSEFLRRHAAERRRRPGDDLISLLIAAQDDGQRLSEDELVSSTILNGLKGGLRDIRGGQAAVASAPRTDQDLSMKFVIGGIIALIIMILLARTLHMNLLGAIMIIAFGFLFVTVSSRLTGEIGSTSNPISGMTVATLLFTCLIFLAIGWTGPTYFVTALSVGAIVCIASSNGGTTSQDLKTGFLVGGTPRLQQIAILVGALASAVILGPILLRLNDTATVYVPQVTFERLKDGAPQLPTGGASALPLYTDEKKPASPDNYRLLTVAPGTQAPAEGIQPGEYLVDDSGRVAYRVQRNFPADLRTNPSALESTETLEGPQQRTDQNSYRVWHKTSTDDGPAGKYLVNDQGVPVYLADPGINGTHRTRPVGYDVDPDAPAVGKFDAPKATLMSYIIKGILNQELPWGLVLLGAMISIVLEMSGIPSLAFAVGVYLPLSSSSPIFIGGLIRWLVDRSIRKKLQHKNLTEEQLVAEGDKSPGVLLSSGYIAGGAIAGIIIAFMAGVLTDVNDKLSRWSTESNPFFDGPWSDLLSLIPFVILIVLLYLAGREFILASKGRPAKG